MTHDLSTVKCPFCLSTIPKSAQVCRYCGRDVSRLIEAERKIKQLEDQLKNVEVKQATSDQDNPWAFRIPLWSFYALSTLSLLILHGYLNLEILIFAMAFVTGIIVLGLGSCNIWKLFLAGFAQPFISISILILLRKISADTLLILVGQFFLFSLKIGFSTALGGMVIILLRRQKLRTQQFSLSPFFDWLSTSESRLDQIHKLVLIISAIVAAILQLISSILSLTK